MVFVKKNMTIIVVNIIKKFPETIVLIEKKFHNANKNQSNLYVGSTMINLSILMQANAWPAPLVQSNIFMISLVIQFLKNRLIVVEKVRNALRDNVLRRIYVLLSIVRLGVDVKKEFVFTLNFINAQHLIVLPITIVEMIMSAGLFLIVVNLDAIKISNAKMEDAYNYVTMFFVLEILIVWTVFAIELKLVVPSMLNVQVGKFVTLEIVLIPAK